MLYEYLSEKYKVAEPIFFSDVEVSGMTRSALNQQLKKLCGEHKLEKYGNGIYYIPKKSRLKSNISLSAEVVAKYKYIAKDGKIEGFYSGNTFANQLGISVQVPNKIEIVSNKMSAKVREVQIGKRVFIVRKPIVPITKENVYILQLLDLLKNIDAYVDENYDNAREKVKEFVKTHNITKKDIDLYIRKYPMDIFKNYYELRMEDVFTY